MDNPYQNPEIEVRNPFATTQVPEINTQPSKPPSKKFSLPNDPKIKLLIILGVIILFLSLISVVITAIRKSQLKPSPVKPTPTMTYTTPVPTDPPTLSMPPEINTQFENIDTSTKKNIQFDPPQIDPDIGL